MPVSVDQFAQQLIASSLMSAADLNALLVLLPAAQQPKDGEQLARFLVSQRKITAFQAQYLYKGKGKSLVLGNYIVLDKLGQGGMGVVFKAEHRRMKRVVALKVLSPTLMKTPEAVRRFQREVEATAKLEHPNIVTAYDADEALGTHFLVSQFVEGIDLAELVRRQKSLSVENAITLVLQVARGLEYAHAHGVVHRDIKPSNLLVDQQGNVKILDMGLARLESAGAEQDQLTGTGQIMGTVDYMAPEQAMDTRNADGRADIYSLGITLWYLLSGRPVFDGETMMAKLLAHRERPIPSLKLACPQVSTELDATFSRMVAKTPAARFQNMTEVIAALERCLAANCYAIERPDTVIADGSQFKDFVRGLKPSRESISSNQAEGPQNRIATSDNNVAATTVSPQIDTDPVTQQSLEIELTEPNLVRAVPQVSAGSLRNVWIAAGSAVLLLALLGLATRVFHIRPEGITRAGDHGQTNDVAAGKKATPEEKNVVVVAPMNPPIAPVTVSTTSGSPPRTPDTPVPVMVPQSKSSSPSKGGSLPAQFPQRPQVAAQNGLRTQRVTPVAPTVDFAAERKAAEWLVSIGGQFIMVGESGGICKLVNGALPPERFSLQSVDLTNNPRLTDAGLANLAVCRRLAQLTLKGNDNITDEALTQLQRLLSLSDLRIEECPKLTGSVLRKLSQLENLRDLTMPMIDADVHWISPPLQLRSLNVSVTSLTDRGLEELARCQPGLERLILDSRGTATLHALAHFRNLQSVLFSESQLNAETARVLAGIPTLRRIDSWGGPPVAGTFQRMSVIKQLQELRFYNATPLEYPITDADFNSLLQLPALTYLQFEGVSPSDIALQKLAGIASLQTLMVVVMRTEFRRYSPAGIAKFRELRPDVRFMIDGKYQPVSPK